MWRSTLHLPDWVSPALGLEASTIMPWCTAFFKCHFQHGALHAEPLRFPLSTSRFSTPFLISPQSVYPASLPPFSSGRAGGRAGGPSCSSAVSQMLQARHQCLLLHQKVSLPLRLYLFFKAQCEAHFLFDFSPGLFLLSFC